MTDTKHTTVHLKLWAGLIALVTIILPVLWVNAQTTATLYTDGTNFGIGTTNPTQKLQVIGSISATAFVGDGSGLTGVSGSATGWTDGGNNVYVSTTTDNVGIGTTTPTAALLVENAGTQASFRVNDAVLDGTPFIIDSAGNMGIGTTETTSQVDILNPSGDGSLTLRSSGNDAWVYLNPANGSGDYNWRIKGSGSTGVFSIVEQSQIVSYVDFQPGLTNSSVTPLTITGSGNVGIGTSTPLGGFAIMNGNVGIGTWNPINRLSILGNIGIGTTLPYRRISAPNNGMVVEGNVGVGTWNPQAKLQVVGSVIATSFVGDGSGLTGVVAGGWTDAGTNIYTTTTSDRVGIGTANPSSPLEVVSTLVNDVTIFRNTNSSGYANTQYINNNGNAVYVGIGGSGVADYPDGAYVFSNNSVPISFANSSVSRMTIGTAGGVGIGTTLMSTGMSVMNGNVGIGTWSSPANRLSILGNIGIGTTLPYRRISAPNNGMVVEGNVGIGTWYPQAKLQVVGAVRATSFTGDGSGLTGITFSGGLDSLSDAVTDYVTDHNMRIGSEQALPSGAEGNLFVGEDAGGNAKTNDADYNLGIGYHTLFSLETGDSNIAIGYNSLAANTQGRRNVAIGFSALAVAVGAPDAASYNVAVGYSALASNTTSSANTVVGHLAMDQGTIGDANTVMGSNAARSSEGNYNVSIGYDSMHDNTTGFQNTVLGTSALNNNTDGNNSVAIGYGSLSGMIAGGTENIAVGFQSGDNITTGDRNIIIGYDIDAPSATGDNQLNIGNVIYGDIATDNVGIGTSTPVGGFVVMSGNAGIGTWSPTKGLQVIGNAQIFGASSAVGTEIASVRSSGTHAPLNFMIGSSTQGSMRAETSEGMAISYDWDGDTFGDLNFMTGEGVSAATRMTLTGSGRVGIGTTVPVAGMAVMNGNVGIGTWSPTARLQVVGSVMATSFVGDGSGLTGISGGATGWTDGGTNVYTSTTTDNVGIGTTTPSTTLEIVKQSTNTLLMVSATATGDGNYLIVRSDGNIGIGTTAPIGALTIMNGNVGIGTWKPEGSLHIEGGQLLFPDGSQASPGLVVNDDSDTGFYSGGSGILAFASNATKVVDFSTNRVEITGAQFRTDDGSYSFPGSSWTNDTNTGLFRPAEDSIDIVLGGTDRVRFDPAGNVGLGTRSPINTLSVVGNIGIGTTLPYRRISAPNNGMVVEGNVGLGTWNPTAKLHVVGSVMATSFVGDGSALTGVAAGGWADGGTNVYTSTTTDNVGIGTTTPANAKLAVLGGNVGIGTVNPVGAFTVVGGNVGIGTWSPRAALEVKNSVVFSSEYDEGSEGGAFTINWNNGNKQKVTLTGSTSHTVTFTAISGGVANFLLKIVQGDASNTITWPASVKWPGASAPTMTAASGSVDIVTCYYDGTNYYCTGSLDLR